MVRRVIGCSEEDTSIFGWTVNRRSVTVSGKDNSSPGSE